MKFSRKATTLALALAMMASATTAFAAPGEDLGGNTPGEAERKGNGHTTISIMTAATALENVSFEVPLYATMAVIKTQANVETPKNYQIKNTAKAGGRSIGVTAVNFAKLADTGFNTVAATPTAATEILLTIGGATMPALNAKGSKNAVLTGSVFVKETKPASIAAASTLNLPIVGTVTAVERTDGGAVAQFRVVYTVSALDAAGNPMGAVYAGDDSFRAGLGDQSTPTP